MVFVARRRDRPSETQVSPRAEWYDRNPTRRSQFYIGNGIAPHSPTTRFTYTVPSGKKAWLELVHHHIRRATVPTTSGLISVGLNYTPYLGSAIPAVRIDLINATVDTTDKTQLGLSAMMATGDVLDGWTGDGSTGGTVDYRNSAKITEFDA